MIMMYTLIYYMIFFRDIFIFFSDVFAMCVDACCLSMIYVCVYVVDWYDHTWYKSK